MPVRNVTQNTLMASQVLRADNPFTRMKGLLGRSSLNAQQALVISPCQSVHMIFMRFPIDVVFLNDRNQVIGLCPDLKPFRFSPIFWKSACAIELPAGTIKKTQTQLGDQIVF